MLKRVLELRKLKYLANIFNESQDIYFLQIEDESDQFLIYMMDANNENAIIRAYNGNFLECKRFIKDIPLINIKSTI